MRAMRQWIKDHENLIVPFYAGTLIVALCCMSFGGWWVLAVYAVMFVPLLFIAAMDYARGLITRLSSRDSG